MTRYRWVAARKAEGFPITAACKVAEVSRQAFFDWRVAEAAGPGPAQRAEAALVSQIRSINEEFDGTYGEPASPRSWPGGASGPTTSESSGSCAGTASWACTSRPRSAPPSPPRTPRRCPTSSAAASLLGAPDVAWVGEITYVATGEGWLYLASVLDLGSRRLLGYSMAEHMRTDLVVLPPARQ